MKTISIKTGESLAIAIYETPDKRADFEPDPHPYGFYHYPDNIQDKTAFGRLKKVMIEDREFRIKFLQEEIKKLKGLVYENNQSKL